MHYWRNWAAQMPPLLCPTGQNPDQESGSTLKHGVPTGPYRAPAQAEEPAHRKKGSGNPLDSSMYDSEDIPSNQFLLSFALHQAPTITAKPTTRYANGTHH